MYAAKKYFIDALENICRNFLKSSLAVDNACTLLNQSMVYGDESLTKECTLLILQNAQEVIAKDDFLNLSHEALVSLLQPDELIIEDESALFAACIRWCEQHIRREGLAVTDQEIRKTLGKAIYLIRFPLMTISDFADNAGSGDILSADEKASVYFFLASTRNKDAAELKFNSKPRGRPLHKCSRFEYVEGSVYEYWICNGKKIDSITFDVDKTILLRGLSVYGGINGVQDASANVTITESVSGKVVRSVDKSFTCDGTSVPVPLYTGAPIVIKPFTKHDVSVLLKCDKTFYGEAGKLTVGCGNVTFRFHSTKIRSRTSVDNGQIPELLFNVVDI